MLILYETRYGATRAIAEEIATGARGLTTVEVRAVEDLALRDTRYAELIVLGVPARRRSRRRDRGADGTASGAEDGMVAWLERSALPVTSVYAAFDTHGERPRLIGRRTAARLIVALLRGRSVMVGAPPASFVESVDHQLDTGERARARAWGEAIARQIIAVRDPRT